MNLSRSETTSSPHDGEIVSREVYEADLQHLESLRQTIEAQERRIADLQVETGKQLALHEIFQNCIDDRSISDAVRSKRIRIIAKYAAHLLGEVAL